MVAPFLRFASVLVAGALGATGPAAADAPRTTVAWGISWAPESFFEALMRCGDHCQGPPMLMLGVPAMEASKLGGVEVEATRGPTGETVGRGRSSEDGAWHIEGLPSDAPAPYYFLAHPKAPDDGYLETFTSRPLLPTFSLCAMQLAPLLRQDGVAAAVRSWLHGRSAAISVVAVFRPGRRLELAPASGITLSAPAGVTVLKIGFRPSPAEGQPGHFFVQHEEGPSATGMFAVVFPPEGAPEIRLTAHDHIRGGVHPSDEGRPWHGTLSLTRPPASAIGYAPFHLQLASGELPYLAPEPMVCNSTPSQP